MSKAPKALWEVGQELVPQGTGADFCNPEFFKTVVENIALLDGELRELSLDISGLFGIYTVLTDSDPFVPQHIQS